MSILARAGITPAQIKACETLLDIELQIVGAGDLIAEEIDFSYTYAEQAERFRQKSPELYPQDSADLLALAELCEAAQSRWDEIENTPPQTFMASVIKQYADQIEQASGGIEYCKEALARPDLEDWERKEYQAVLDGYTEELPKLQNHMEYLKTL